MDDLLDAQLELETICDHVGQRDDILQPARLKRMKGPLRYASRYYHDVHEDFEKGRVRLDGGFYALGGAFNLNDYLRSSREKPDRPAAVAYQLKLLRSNLLPLSQRAQALEELIEASPIDPTACPVTEDGLRQGDKIRYADAAGACFELLSMELAQVRAKLLS